MTLREMRHTGARALFSRRWFGRAMFATAVLYALQGVVACFFAWARKSIGFATWGDFAQSKAQQLAQGMVYAVPSRAAALNYTYATGFELFLTMIVGGICLYGFAAFALRMVRDDASAGYLAGSLGGLARPLAPAWLLFRIQVQCSLWALLLLYPGVVAWYRYRAAWFLKAENPDWSAGKCLAESARLMDGNKMRCFSLDCSYWLSYTAVIVLTFVLCASVLGGAQTLVMPLAIFAIAVLVWRIHAGHAVFYVSIVSKNKETPVS